ncbi:hypothetical protein AAIR98_001327 [Elusimicrobium simillimum]|uniref:hypothetical protein n=1 Tax=Elusimicrobium simillimum TaxID=3143438 RepID=UPI003C6FA9D0
MKKLILLLPVVFLVSACATTGTNPNSTKLSASTTNFVITTTKEDLNFIYDAVANTYTGGVNVVKAPRYQASNLLEQLDRSFSSIEMEFDETPAGWTVIEGKLDDREVSKFNDSPHDIYVLVFKDLKQRNFVELIFNKHQKNYFDKVRPGDNIKALCLNKRIRSKYLYASIWKHTAQFTACIPLN